MDYPIAGNDDAIRSVRMILATVNQTLTQAQAEYETKYARRKTVEEAAPPPPRQRSNRSRRPRRENLATPAETAAPPA